MSDNLKQFSFYITKATQDAESKEMRWACVGSDTEEDSYLDEMSIPLFKSFIARIDKNELAPEKYRTDFWTGGKPYLSVSHYSDGNGKSVPGPVDVVYLDGNRLKAKGRFDDTPLGRAAFNAVRETVKTKSHEKPVRISIGFLDFMHQHKSDNSIFERKSLDHVCEKCIKERMEGISKGLRFLDGHLIHLALTRVPVNKRTSMEIEKSMATKLEDAASIVGEENAEELEQIEQELANQQKSLVVKSEDDTSEGDEKLNKLLERLDGLEEQLRSKTMENTELVEEVEATEAVEKSALELAFESLSEKLGTVDKSTATNMAELQPEFDKLAEVIRSEFPADEEAPAEAVIEEKAENVAELVKAEVANAIQPLVEQMKMMQEKAPQNKPAPVQRSVTAPTLVVPVNDPAKHQQVSTEQKPKLSSLDRMINRSVGLSEDFVRPGAKVKETG